MPGACGLALHSSGNFLLSSGSDSIVRAHDVRDVPGRAAWWRSETPKEPELTDMTIAELHDKAVDTLDISPNGTLMATGCDDGFVRLFSVSGAEKGDKFAVDGEFIQSCARFAGPVRCVAFSPTGAFVAAAGDEPGVLKLVMTATPSNATILRVTNGVAFEAFRALFYDPKSDYVISIGESGVASVWDADKCINVGKVELNGRKANHAAWSPDGGCIVFATDSGVVFVSRNKWSYDFLLEDANEDGDEDDIGSHTGKDIVSAVAWSPNGRYLLASKENFSTTLWDVEERKVLGSWKTNEVPQKLIWHSSANAFVFIDRIGQWGIVPDVVPTHLASPFGNATRIELPSFPDVDDKEKKKPKHVANDDDDDEERQIKRSKAKHRRKKTAQKKSKNSNASKNSKQKEPLSEAEEDNDDNDQQLENGFTFDPNDVEADDEEDYDRKNANASDGSDESDDDSDSDEEVPGEFEGLENGGVQLPPRRKKKGSRSHTGGGRPVFQGVVHKPFMPTSTPLSEKQNKGRHILTWNVVGAVMSFDEKTHDIVAIEFSDATKRTITIKDHFGYTMASISEWGVLLASNKKKEHGALFTFRPFHSWAHNSEWTSTLNTEDDISCVALGKRFCAIATAPSNLVRVFSLSGLQTSSFGVPGTIITLAALDRKLVIVYGESASTILKCEVIEIDNSAEIGAIQYEGNLVKHPNASLEWVGFTNDTIELCCYDSNGWLWMLTDTPSSKRWVPMMQNAAHYGECDWFWVAAATSTNLIGVSCLSNERFPAAKPRPALRSLKLSAPVLEKVSKTGKPPVVERLMRTKLDLQRARNNRKEVEEECDSDDSEVEDAMERVSRVEVETDKCLLALMEDACKREQNMRAYDIATRLNCEVSFKYAVELARHYKRNVLVEKVDQVAMQKMDLIATERRARRKRTKERTSMMTSHHKTAQDEEETGMDYENDDRKAVTDVRKEGIRRSKAPSRAEAEEEDVIEQIGKNDEADARRQAALEIMDITDDEEENCAGQEDEKEGQTVATGDRKKIVDADANKASATSEERPTKAAPKVEKKRKRKTPPAASQASMGGHVKEQKKGAKRARSDNVKGKRTGGTKPFFNRFLKKS
ncbi:Anaphase-promoting complex subunit 4 WD40 [Gracilaria domingensis]|nr:Anaphase-promoting complex subunit 4 WD40 [Gracilaria domingensis]